MTQFVAALWLGIWLYFGTFLAVPPAFAAGNLAQTGDQVEALSDRNLTRIQQFLGSLPRDYYTVRQINQVKALSKEQQALLIDVREPKEYASGHIKGAINLPLRSLTDNLVRIPKNRPVILYCSTGYRTAMGVMALQMLGYDNVRGFPPSLEGWKTAGEALEQSRY
ncbi:rhodanese-like domain-containing protein [Cyanothece sp. BG0011]|uniref:rhodanese-like domain-containing protein n=1 Tax=Cyanothece sp. BG0011 TaxID=2082950 RepID=UPI000D1E72A1|nr:rhodanese-like domain-containing protein [Cyanothece sp. BG0011]